MRAGITCLNFKAEQMAHSIRKINVDIICPALPGKKLLMNAKAWNWMKF